MEENYLMAKERNEKNKAFRKRLKNYYIGAYGLLGVFLLGSGVLYMLADSRTALIICLCVLGIIFVVWLLWCVIGGIKTCCPHCDSYIGRSDPWNIRICPYCGMSLEIRQYFGREKL